MNLNNVYNAIRYTAKNISSDTRPYNRDISHTELAIGSDGPYFHAWLEEIDGHKVRADLVLNFGIYYRLPYSDLIRVGMAATIAFSDNITGLYEYSMANTHDTMSYRHNYIGMELTCIHCFRTHAQRVAKKKAQNYESKWGTMPSLMANSTYRKIAMKGHL